MYENMTKSFQAEIPAFTGVWKHKVMNAKHLTPVTWESEKNQVLVLWHSFMCVYIMHLLVLLKFVYCQLHKSTAVSSVICLLLGRDGRRPASLNH